MQIEDGLGSGRKAGVNAEGKLQCSVVSNSVEHHVNHHDGKAYQIQVEQVPTGNDDCIFYLKNLNDVDIVVEEIILYVGAGCEVYVKVGDSGTPISGTDVVPVNANVGSGNSADGTFQKGANITGLTNGKEIFRFKFAAETASKNFNFPQDVIIPKNQVLTVWVDTLSVNVMFNLAFNYHSTAHG